MKRVCSVAITQLACWSLLAGLAACGQKGALSLPRPASAASSAASATAR